MNLQGHIYQYPQPGSRIVMFRGDTLTFTLSLSEAFEGRAWIRTNIGHASMARRAVIEAVEGNRPLLGTEWFDLPMRPMDDRHFTITLPLAEVGHFEAKCFFMPAGKITPRWPQGHNTAINVQPANACAANIIYNAFVRQFGPNKDGRHPADAADADCIRRLDEKNYTVIPRSGTFRDLIAELDFIIGRLGCRFVHLLPISQTPTTYGRMGRFGSPYAALHFTGIDPALAVFDFKSTPLQQFLELVDAVHARHAGLIIDIAVNHTGWAASLHETHPDWLIRDVRGDIHSPGAWGVVWRDLTSLDYSQKGLWQYIADVFLTWCRRGVDGFRCDAGYMIPLPAWSYIIACVREQFPETIFLLEGLGGRVSVTRDLLCQTNFNWAYSELFQNYDRAQIHEYLPQAIDISKTDGLAVHYAETHDNNRLAARSATYARMRTALCALLSSQGAFGFANGVEWLADIKINVHEAHPLNWGSPVNQVAAIRRLNILLRFHPAFFDEVDLKLITQGEGNVMALRRLHQPSGKKLVIVVNLDDGHPSEALWDLQPDMDQVPVMDLLTGQEVLLARVHSFHGCRLGPGQVLCLTADPDDLALLKQGEDLTGATPRVQLQKRKAKVLDVLGCYRGTKDISDVDLAYAADELSENPVEFCRVWNPLSGEHRVVFWQWPRDLKREVMAPPGHFLLVKADAPFSAMIIGGRDEKEQVIDCDESLPAGDGGHFILFVPREIVPASIRRTLKLTVHEKGGSRHESASVLYLSSGTELFWPTRLYRNDLMRGEHLFLSTNGLGGMCRAHVRWGRLNSKYDALLAANLHSRYPDDRRVMFTRCRAWVVYQGYSQEIGFDSLDTFHVEGNAGYWSCQIPTGQGERIDLRIVVEMLPGENTVRLTFYRLPAGPTKGRLTDDEAVQLILRPDIEDRNFHETTKAYTGPETAWPAATAAERSAFVFEPAPQRCLTMRITPGRFVREPEWHYMVSHPLDAQRGMDPHSDLWSPGFFSVLMQGNDTVYLTASVNSPAPRDMALPTDGRVAGMKRPASVEESLYHGMKAFVVKRDALKSVIAGYPWFLDWGRDSLIFARGLIEAGMTDDARAVLKLFGALEEQGTLPNMIHGHRTGNRTTSDAPLWFVVACADLVKRDNTQAFLDERCGGRTVKDILLSIGRCYAEGTGNGIRMDEASGLIHSPACFTWMDTNYPACTPRRGYCIEIQALWHAVLVFLSSIDPGGRRNWAALAGTVSQSITDLFVLKKGYLADCLQADAGMPAKSARADDALRPNQLLALTLDAVADKAIGRSVLDACQTLLVPGAIRSLGDEATDCPLAVIHNGCTINDPHHPYRGCYAGDEDTGRKPAYHNGTAWTWPFPSYCEAYAKVYGEKGKAAARSWMASSLEIIREGCVGHVPEILDGDYPHTPRGCDAQAWGLSEWLRVWELLKEDRG